MRWSRSSTQLLFWRDAVEALIWWSRRQFYMQQDCPVGDAKTCKKTKLCIVHQIRRWDLGFSINFPALYPNHTLTGVWLRHRRRVNLFIAVFRRFTGYQLGSVPRLQRMRSDTVDSWRETTLTSLPFPYHQAPLNVVSLDCRNLNFGGDIRYFVPVDQLLPGTCPRRRAPGGIDAYGLKSSVTDIFSAPCRAIVQLCVCVCVCVCMCWDDEWNELCHTGSPWPYLGQVLV